VAGLQSALENAIPVAFALLVVAILADWLRHRDRQRTYLVVALVSLAFVVLLGPFLTLLRLSGPLVVDVSLFLFLVSGYALLMFRDSLIPLGTRPRAVITVAIAAVAVLGVAANLNPDPAAERTPFQLAAVGLIVVTWALCVLEPTFRLGLASIGRPAVEGARLRSLSLGYAGLVVVVMVATVAAPLLQTSQAAVVLADLTVLAVVPLMYASFSPPVWLRRLWSQPEEDAFRQALHDLLLYSPDRSTLAHRALDWGARLVGGAGAYIVDSDGSILAAHAMSTDEAARLAAHPTEERSALIVPLDLEQGKGSMTIISGPFTPIFGQDEVNRLRQYAGSITAGLDRVSLTQRIASLEKAKTEFLNIASHELRGPMTVIKGYLTMIAAGSLGEVSPRASSVLPLLIAKSDEVNAMLEQMVEASRLEDGRLALKKERTDISELTDLVIENLHPLLSEHQVNVQRPQHPVWADVDPDRFQIVIRNLISNAVKYSPAGADVTVRVQPDGDCATVAVTDEGIGIAAEDQTRLFKRFGRIENQATARTTGTGLGLWLSREIARMHDGDLTVESEPGKGSTFTVEIPINRN
jgi:signal transduction histidine kinase